MANLSALKRRIKSINNTLKTTAAMQLIASVKMRRAVDLAQNSRAFAQAAEEILARLLQRPLDGSHPLLEEREVKRVTLVVLAAEKGLCGSFNSDVIRQAATRAKEWQEKGAVVSFVAVGKKARSINRYGDVAAYFTDLGETVSLAESSPVGRFVLDSFTAGECDRVEVVYKKFVSTLKQETANVALIPVDRGAPTNEANDWVYSFEPSAEAVLEAVLPFLVRSRLFQMMLESDASEQAARMVAMQSATDAGRDLSADLVFTANSIRQEKITAEVAEITSGTAAMQ